MAIQHYEGGLGTFDYDDKEFEVINVDRQCLSYIGNEPDGSKIHIPDGLIDCFVLFANCSFLETPPVIPDGVKNCEGMFANCTALKFPPVIPESVESTNYMFALCPDMTQKIGLWHREHKGYSYTDFLDGLINKYGVLDILKESDIPVKLQALTFLRRIEKSSESAIYSQILDDVKEGYITNEQILIESLRSANKYIDAVHSKTSNQRESLADAILSIDEDPCSFGSEILNI